MEDTEKTTKYYIYCLEFNNEYNEKTGEYDAIKRYIGKTNNLKRRWDEHKKGYGGTANLRHKNFKNCKFILEDVGNKENIQKLEQKWIDYWGGVDNLLNTNKAIKKTKKKNFKKKVIYHNKEG